MDGVLIVPAERIPSLLPMDTCITAVTEAFLGLELGTYAMPLRNGYRLPQEEFSILGNMPSFAALESKRRYCCNKCVSVFPQNVSRGLHSHQGAILLFEAVSGVLEAIVDASQITAIRTGAASAVATRLLAQEGVTHLCLIGSGVQAAIHLEAMLLVRPSLCKVTVWSRTPSRLDAFVQAQQHKYPDLTIIGIPGLNAQQAVAGADIICTVTSALEPVLRGEWVKAGAHVNAVGACTPNMRELDSDLVANAQLYTDSREACLKEPGCIRVPLQEGVISEDHVRATIGELLMQERKQGSLTDGPQREDGNMTLFKSLGMAVQDLAAAILVVDAVKMRAAQDESGGLDGCVSVDLNGTSAH